MTLSEKDLKYIWHPYSQAKKEKPPIPIVRGEGVWLFDESGNKYLDAISSWWVNLHGHANPYIAEKISAQAKKLEQVIFAGFTHEPAITLAERILNLSGGNFSKAFYSDNGSTAVEVALKMALQFWHNQGQKKTRIIAFKDAYHGDTFGAMSASGRSIFTDPFTSLLFDVVHIDPPLPGNEAHAIAQLKSAAANAAAFIFEPLVMGAGGMKMYEPQPLDEMISFCREKKILTIADEVMTGFGRTGKLFACDYLQHKPDIMCLSKGITGGFLPLGLTVCTEKIYDAFYSDDRTKTFFHGHSYTANPLACAAGLASLDLMETEDFFEKLLRIHKQHLDFKKDLQKLSTVSNPRAKGTILAFEYSDNESSYLNSVRDSIYDFFISRKILLRPLGNTIYILPPYCITEKELEVVYEAISDFAS